MTFIGDFQEPDPLRATIQAAILADETTCIEALVGEADPGVAVRRRITALATTLVERIRDREQSAVGLDAFMHECDLSSQPGRSDADVRCCRWRNMTSSDGITRVVGQGKGR